jgi:hypothetical protein
LGASHKVDEDMQIIAELRVYKKNSESTFKIEEDDTSVNLKDDLSRDSYFGFPLTASIGLRFRKEWSAIYTQVIVPDRVLLPSLTLTWHFYAPDGAKESDPVKTEAPTSQPVKEQIPTQRKRQAQPRRNKREGASSPKQMRQGSGLAEQEGVNQK